MTVKFTTTLEPPNPTPFEQAQSWAYNANWEVFGDWYPGDPSYTLRVLDSGGIYARNSDNYNETFIGTWEETTTGGVSIKIEHNILCRK